MKTSTIRAIRGLVDQPIFGFAVLGSGWAGAGEARPGQVPCQPARWLSQCPGGQVRWSGLKSQASTYSKNTLHATEHLKRVQMDFHFNQWDVNHSEVPYEISTFPEREA